MESYKPCRVCGHASAYVKILRDIGPYISLEFHRVYCSSVHRCLLIEGDREEVVRNAWNSKDITWLDDPYVKDAVSGVMSGDSKKKWFILKCRLQAKKIILTLKDMMRN